MLRMKPIHGNKWKTIVFDKFIFSFNAPSLFLCCSHFQYWQECSSHSFFLFFLKWTFVFDSPWCRCHIEQTMKIFNIQAKIGVAISVNSSLRSYIYRISGTLFQFIANFCLKKNESICSSSPNSKTRVSALQLFWFILSDFHLYISNKIAEEMTNQIIKR